MARLNKTDLIDGQGKSVVGDDLHVTADGTRVELVLGAGRELTDLDWRIRPTGGTDGLTCTYATDLGVVTKDGWPKKPVSWATADWGEERAISSIQVVAAPGEEAKKVQERAISSIQVLAPSGETATKVRVRVFRSGAWFPLPFSDLADMDAERVFPMVLAGKLMVEPVIEQTVATGIDGAMVATVAVSASAKLTKLEVKASRVPFGLAVSVGDSGPAFELDGAVPAAAPVRITGLEPEINAWLAAHPQADAVPLRLRSEVPGSIRIEKCAAETLNIARAFNGGGEIAEIQIPWQKEVGREITVGDGSLLRSVAFRARADLLPQRVLLSPAASSKRFAHLCDPEHSAAQLFRFDQADAVGLSGVDLYLRPAARVNRLVLGLHPDSAGRPGPRPYGGANLEVALEAESGPPYRPAWVAFDFEKPLPLRDPAWWLVLDVPEGEVHWLLGEKGPSQAADARYRVGQGAWLARAPLPDGGSTDRPWAQTRLRAAASAPELGMVLARGKGELQVPLVPAEETTVVDQDGLAVLNSSPALPGDKLRFVFTAKSAGKITVSNLRVRYSPNGEDEG